MIDLWFTTGNWKWSMKAKMTLEQALKCVENAAVVAKTLGIWDPRGVGEFALNAFIEGARTKTKSPIRNYDGTHWYTYTSRGPAMIALGTAAQFIEAWANLPVPDDAESVDQLSSAIVIGLARMCETIADKETGLANFPRLMDAIFGEAVELKPG